MEFDPEIHHRRSIRLRGYDYSQPGAYFLTICTQEKLSLFGEVVESEMVLNDAGQMVRQWWFELPRKFPRVELDRDVVMPNHVHDIVRIVGADRRVRPGQLLPSSEGAHAGAPLHRVVQWFKTMTTNDYLRHVHEDGWPSLRSKLWQRNYYEHIIRNQHEFEIIQEYIATNPLRWDSDPENLDRIGA
jgi:REP element-mobilizing transposase RayT